jgi:hypothetical protein
MSLSLSSQMRRGGGGRAGKTDASGSVARVANTSSSIGRPPDVSGTLSHFGESFLPNIGKWANNLGSPVVGQVQDHTPSSLLGKSGLRAWSLSISTPRQLEAFLQDREDINFEQDEGVAAGNLGGGEWECKDVGVAFRGRNGAGFEWIIVGEDGGQSQCRDRISGGSRFCVQALDYCQIHSHELNKVDLYPGHLYLMSSEKGRIKSVASSAWHAPVAIFGGRIMKLSYQTFSDVEFKRFCYILIAQIEQGLDPNTSEWEPVDATVTRPSSMVRR